MVIMCEYCNKEFKFPCFLARHLNNKNKCIDKKNKCNECGKTFTQNWKYNLHKKRKTSCVKNYIKFTNNKIKHIEGNIYGDNNTIIKNQNININIQPSVNFILPFGKDNKDIVTKEMMMHILKFAAMPVMYFRIMHLNPKHPEQHNVILKNKKENKMNIKTKDGWKEQSLMEFIADYINNLQLILYLYKEESKETCKESKWLQFIKDKINDFDYKFDCFLQDDKILPDVKQWIKSIRTELVDAQSMLLASKRKDRGKLYN